MAENSRGQNRNGQQNSDGAPSNPQDNNRLSKKSTSSRGLRNTDLDRVRNNNRTPKSSRLSEKTSISGSDYDGQLSDE
jgi:hypothetical protein